MSTQYPYEIQTFSSPAGTSKLNNPDHASMHVTENDTLVELQTKLGFGGSTPGTSTILTGSSGGTSVWSKTWTGGTIISPTLTTPTLTQQSSTPAAPAAGKDLIYTDTSGALKIEHSSGSVDVVGYGNGWIDVNETWTYASATTITVPTDATTKYQKGDKIRLVQSGSTKYFYIIGVAATTLTITGGSDYTLTNVTITGNSYSKSATPLGFPDYFNLTTPTFTTSIAPFTNQPTAYEAKFSIVGKTCRISLYGRANAVSGGTGAFIMTFTAGQLPTTFQGYDSGSFINMSSMKNGPLIFEAGVSTIRFVNYDNTTPFTNNEYFGLSGFFRYSA